jgi:hypothetical protein
MSRWNDTQLQFDLELDEIQDVAVEHAISPDEARLISETARIALERRSGASLPDWWQDYLRLLEQGWPWRIACYMAWASSPKATRWPKTIQELATDVLGLTGPRVIYVWRKKHPSINQVVAMLQAAPLWEHRSDVIRALVESALQPDYKSFNDRKLFLEMTGDYTPRSRMDINRSGKSDDLSELSDAELDALLGDRLENQNGSPSADDQA